MMFKDLIVLLPCQSLENLSLDREGTEAQQLLSAWTAMYHPAIMAQASASPRWASAESPPEDVASSLIVLPECAEGSLPTGWVEESEKAGAHVVRRLLDRNEIVTVALNGVSDSHLREVSSLTDDFLSLGFCHFVVELVTRQLRYMSNLDSERFYRHTADALQHLVQNDESAAREQLRFAFDRLTEAREYFYPVQTYLIDLTLVAETTLGEGMRRELASESPVNLLISGAVVERMAQEEPSSLALLKEGLEKGGVTLVGGEYDEHELPLMAPEAIVEQFRHGLETYERYLGHRPTIFGRRRFGLSPVLPQILKGFGFVGALHFTLDEGRFPSGNQSKIRWEGIDGTEIEALARIPLEVDRPENFLRLPTRLGNTLDADQGGAIVFAHWAGQSSPWFEDLRRMGQYGPALGKLTGLAAYFENTMYSGQTVRHSADKYRSPYLKQEAAAEGADPISRWARYHRQCVSDGDARSLGTISALVRDECSDEGLPNLDQLADSIASAESPAPQGLLLLNPRSHRVRWPVEVPGRDALPAVAPPVLAASESEGARQALVEAPGMGFAWVGPESPARAAEKPKARKTPNEPLVVEEHELRNEYFQARISPTTGAIQSLQSYAVRGNRLAQQIAMRLPPPAGFAQDVDPEAEENYSLMAADEITSRMSSPMVGTIVSRGRLVDRQGERVGRFVQTMIARRGSPLLEVEIELDLARSPEPDPRKSYVAARFAWSDETADVFQGVGLCRQPSDGKFLESPHFIEIHAPKTRLTIFPAGLPYHRRFGLRKLDTLLVVHGETARKFRFGIGVDVRYPAHTAMEAIVPPAEFCRPASAPSTPWGWLFHLDARNVMATHWEPLCSQGRPTGFRVRLLETEGRHSEFVLRSFRPVASARRVDFLGGLQSELSVDGDGIRFEIRPRQWIQVEATFSGEQTATMDIDTQNR